MRFFVRRRVKMSSDLRFRDRRARSAATEKTADGGQNVGLRHEGKGNKRVTVKFFPEAPNIIIDIRVFNFYVETPLPTKYGICLTRSEWQQFGEHHAQRAHTAVMKKIVRDYLTEKVTEMAKQHCYGCEIDHPSQNQHIGETGCLADCQSQGPIHGKMFQRDVSLGGTAPIQTQDGRLRVSGDLVIQIP